MRQLNPESNPYHESSRSTHLRESRNDSSDTEMESEDLVQVEPVKQQKPAFTKPRKPRETKTDLFHYYATDQTIADPAYYINNVMDQKVEVSLKQLLLHSPVLYHALAGPLKVPGMKEAARAYIQQKKQERVEEKEKRRREREEKKTLAQASTQRVTLKSKLSASELTETDSPDLSDGTNYDDSEGEEYTEEQMAKLLSRARYLAAKSARAELGSVETKTRSRRLNSTALNAPDGALVLNHQYREGRSRSRSREPRRLRQNMAATKFSPSGSMHSNLEWGAMYQRDVDVGPTRESHPFNSARQQKMVKYLCGLMTNKQQIIVHGQYTAADDRIGAEPVKFTSTKRDKRVTKYAIKTRVAAEKLAGAKGLTTDTVEEWEREIGRFRYARRCPTVPVEVDKGRTIALLDSGAEINTVTEAFACKSGMILQNLPDALQGAQLILANSSESGVLALTRHKIAIASSDVSAYATLLVVRQSSYDIILGEPWAVQVRLGMNRLANGTVICKAFSTDGRHMARWYGAIDPDGISVSKRLQKELGYGDEEEAEN